MITKELSTRSMRWKNNARRPGCDQHLAGIARSIQQVDATPSRLDSSTILNNRIYLGEIPHKENSYTGEHAAIIDQELWQKVHAKLAENVHARRHGTNASAPSALRGLLYDEDGNRFTASHAIKNGKRYRYYVSQRVARNGPRSADEPNRIPAR